jgi:hypothetical protein
MALFVEYAIFRLVFLNAFVMALVSFPVYVNFAHCVTVLSVFSFGFSLLDVSSRVLVSYPLFSRVCCMLFFSLPFFR